MPSNVGGIILHLQKERDAKREKFFPKEGVDMKLLAEGLEFKSAEEKEVRDGPTRGFLMQGGALCGTYAGR